jgi:protein gp37
MSEHSGIEWCDGSWNNVRGCQKVGDGCWTCYAERWAERFRGVPGHPYEHGFDVRLVPEKLAEPLRWRKASRVFVNSMSDLFQDAVPDDYIEATCEVMMAGPWHTYQVLTKRPDRMRQLLDAKLKAAAKQPNIWWGVSVENRRHGLQRLDALRRTTAAMRFVSIEPLLEDLGDIDLTGVSWAIVGGESGPGARPMRPEWAESVRVHCESQGVAFFFKQNGGAQKWLTGRELNGKEYNDMPPLSQVPIADRVTRQRLIREIEARYRGRFSGDALISHAHLVQRHRRRVISAM